MSASTVRLHGVGNVLEARGLVKVFEQVRAVDGVDLTVAAGERVALLGPNGAGKTTTLLMLLGAITPDGGSISVLGHDLPRGRSAAMGRVGFVAGYLPLPDRLRVREALSIFAGFYGMGRKAGDAGRRVDDLYNLVYDPAFLVVAWSRVRGNKGARTAGIDGVTPRGVGWAAADLLAGVREDLKAGEFVPLRVREKTIPTTSGKVRALGIPTTRDRRLISLLIRSSGLFDQVLTQWALGNAVNANTSAFPASINGPTLGKVFTSCSRTSSHTCE
jgi:energy-coupling factor transporter ATP-binding protein EcfA2